MKCDIDMRRELHGNNSLPGVLESSGTRERIAKEITSIAPPLMKAKGIVPEERK